MQVQAIQVLRSDAKHLMNELADMVGAALIIPGPGAASFDVIAREDLGDCEREAIDCEILDSRCGG